MSAAPTGQPVLVDTGPLVAWFDRSDADHQRCRRFFSQASGPLISTWPVVTEVCHLVPTALAPRFLEWIQLGGLQLAEIPAAHTAASAGRCHGQLQQPRAWLAHGIGKAARARLVDLVLKNSADLAASWGRASTALRLAHLVAWSSGHAQSGTGSGKGPVVGAA